MQDAGFWICRYAVVASEPIRRIVYTPATGPIAALALGTIGRGRTKQAMGPQWEESSICVVANCGGTVLERGDLRSDGYCRARRKSDCIAATMTVASSRSSTAGGGGGFIKVTVSSDGLKSGRLPAGTAGPVGTDCGNAGTVWNRHSCYNDCGAAVFVGLFIAVITTS